MKLSSAATELKIQFRYTIIITVFQFTQRVIQTCSAWHAWHTCHRLPMSGLYNCVLHDDKPIRRAIRRSQCFIILLYFIELCVSVGLNCNN
jgi:hypothetical protein